MTEADSPPFTRNYYMPLYARARVGTSRLRSVDHKAVDPETILQVLCVFLAVFRLGYIDLKQQKTFGEYFSSAPHVVFCRVPSLYGMYRNFRSYNVVSR